ncbi:hypothetical protein J7F03_05730 [Streptomyces sp. ISL-43]|uniref:hypothetical protein n=1 Tax=Streptomyces sp. ISL-43 TaxID=2819183 RepID=UPI001BED16DB|nr:hypothetical protein [Streptomyces sp. ISL-43]MBT2446589.1 hypothetical protein [Streptomyces sp. ISL-43]
MSLILVEFRTKDRFAPDVAELLAARLRHAGSGDGSLLHLRLHPSRAGAVGGLFLMGDVLTAEARCRELCLGALAGEAGLQEWVLDSCTRSDLL